jgi:DnaJ like chaperone protein
MFSLASEPFGTVFARIILACGGAFMVLFPVLLVVFYLKDKLAYAPTIDQIRGGFTNNSYSSTKPSSCKCPNCSKANDCNDKFCINCGSTLSGSSTSSAQQKSSIKQQCSKCGGSNDADTKFCIHCGKTLSDSPKSNAQQQPSSKKQCKQCGYENDADTKFCIKCGSNTFDHYTTNGVEGASILDCAVALLAYVAKGDGVISSNEALVIGTAFDDLSAGNDEVRNTLINIFNKAKEHQNKDHNSTSKKLYELLSVPAVSSTDRIQFLGILSLHLLALVYIDGSLNVKQNAIAGAVLKNLHFTDTQIRDLHRQFESSQKQSGSAPSVEDYKTIGCLSTDNDDTVKRSYREMVKKYHPDTIHGKGLADEFIDFANKKLKEINGAYERIKIQRGMR